MKHPLPTSCLTLALLAFAAFVQAETPANPETNVEITYRVVGKAALPPVWTILLRSSAAQEATVRYPAPGAEPLRLQLAPESSWEISADLPGFWVPPKNLVVGPAGEPTRVALDLWPLGTLSGRAKVQQKGVAPPREVLVKTVAAPAVLQRPPMPPGVLTCPVDKQGNWSCSLPAGKFDLVITASGFTPHYRWAVEVPPSKTLPLGLFQFERGSSVAGWVAAEGGAIDPKTCVARLSFMAACGADADSLIQLQRIAVERPVSKEGFLQVAGLAPGIYALEVRQPGLAPARVAHVRVDPEAETFLPETLLLTKPIVLDFAVVPPADERGEPWRAKVIRRAEGGSQPDPIVFDGAADSEGRFTLTDQAPGGFRIKILDSRGNTVHSEPERQVEASTRQTIELSRIAVEGLLRLGSEPLQGTLWFGGRYGTIRVKMEADEEGRFTGVLQDKKSGTWIVDIEAAEPKVEIRTRTEVRPDRSGKATALIELPDTRVFGRVVDAQGRPADRAFLLAASESLRQIVPVDMEGKFDLRGLTPGALALLAKDDSAGQSERTLVSLAEGGEVGPVELRLRAMKRLQGVVSSSRGPVAGALIRVQARPPAIGEGQATTGPDGTFSLEIPENVDSAVAAVSAPGYGIQAFPFASEEKVLSFTLSETMGDLVVALPDPAELQRENQRLVLLQNGMELPMLLLGGGVPIPSADADTGSALRFPSLAPGQYTTCLVQMPVASTGTLDPATIAKGACDSGQLATGAALALSLRDDD